VQFGIHLAGQSNGRLRLLFIRNTLDEIEGKESQKGAVFFGGTVSLIGLSKYRSRPTFISICYTEVAARYRR